MRAPVRFLTLLTLLAVVAIAPSAAHAAASWQGGPLSETMGTDCIDGETVYLAGSFMAYLADPSNPPQVGQTFYVSLNATGIGDPCAGGEYADPNLFLPAGVSLAVTPSTPIQCFYNFGTGWHQDTSSDCPTSVGPGDQPGVDYSMDFLNINPPFWALPPGGSIEMHVPVVASTPGALKFQAVIPTADGEGNETMTPSVVAIVNPANTPVAQQISVGYASPSITGDTQDNMTNPPSRDVAIKGFVYNHSNSGTAFAELGEPPPDVEGDETNVCTNPQAPEGYTATAQKPFFETNVVNLATGSGNVDTQITGSFTTIYPDHNYCWRIVALVGASHTEYDGNWQPFLTGGAYITNTTIEKEKNPTPITDPNCSNTTGNGCSTSPCQAGGTCMGSDCGSTSCLATLAPGLTQVVSSPAPTPTPTPTPTPIPTPLPPPPPPSPKLTTHTLKLTQSGSHFTVDTGLSLACPAGGPTCTGTVTGTATLTSSTHAAKHKTTKLTVGTTKLSVAAGKTTAIKITLTSKAVAALKKAKSLRVALIGSYANGTTKHAITKTITIKLPKPKPKKHKH